MHAPATRSTIRRRTADQRRTLRGGKLYERHVARERLAEADHRPSSETTDPRVERLQVYRRNPIEHEKPTFDNQLCTLRFDGRSASLRIERTTPGDGTDPTLQSTLQRQLT